MRALVFFVVVVGVVGQIRVRAQEPDAPSAASDPDFSGIYAGAPTIIEPDVYPFTAEGERAHRVYDPLTGDPRQVDDCAPESMPAILWAGTLNTMRIYLESDTIAMHLEHGGTVRSIHMVGAEPSAAQAHTELGYSRGSWSGDVLTVETTHLAGGVVFTSRGYPVSPQARITERYWREADKSLQMELLIDDPVNYLQPVKLGREWLWAPDEQVLPWNCVSLGPRDAEPDIDELRRLLNQQ
jgi:hypothetical protein